MKFLEKKNHIKLLRFALGISIFSVGYLITMFYFQMTDLKEYKKLILFYNTENITALHLESDVKRNIYITQNQLLNQNISSALTGLEDIQNISLVTQNELVEKNDRYFLNKNIEIKDLIETYKIARKEVLKLNSLKNIELFNSAGSALIDRIEAYIDYLNTKIQSYNVVNDNIIDNSKNSGFLIALISLFIFILSYLKMNEDLYKLRKVNDEIIFANECLNSAEIVAGFGSWKFNTVENKLTVSDNFYRLLGVSPQEFDLTIPVILSYIHPDDREEVNSIHEKSFSNLEQSMAVYRYLLRDGTIKYMVSVSKFLNNAKGELVKIGVNQDVTELMEQTKKLEEKNAKLVSINSELESFNNIVGHDLQEPLRKIQMFISRIESKEFIENASETTVGYLGKIKIAAQKMQNLMTDLVDYSRTIRGDRVIEEVNLNTVFDEIVEELSLTIEEKKAKISIENMPTILGTRFQIQQLFINLVSNALKYVKPEISPIIAIRLEHFDNEMVNEKNISSGDYYKITVSDNGIGFEQKHSDKIFQLFKRLETDQNYKGTGLGLAICKKIVDNNKGMITAVGIPGEGSIFAVYLPKKTS